MAKLRARIAPAGRAVTSRLSASCITTHADTWRTFTEVEVYADGTTFITTTRDGVVILKAIVSAETGAVIGAPTHVALEVDADSCPIVTSTARTTGERRITHVPGV